MIVDYQRRKPFKVSNLLEPITQPERDVFGFHFEHRGLRKGYSVYLESEGERKDWVEKIREQVGVRKVVLESNPVRSRHLPSHYLKDCSSWLNFLLGS